MWTHLDLSPVCRYIGNIVTLGKLPCLTRTFSPTGVNVGTWQMKRAGYVNE